MSAVPAVGFKQKIGVELVVGPTMGTSFRPKRSKHKASHANRQTPPLRAIAGLTETFPLWRQARNWLRLRCKVVRLHPVCRTHTNKRLDLQTVDRCLMFTRMCTTLRRGNSALSCVVRFSPQRHLVLHLHIITCRKALPSATLHLVTLDSHVP